jgi:hypothetical protein
MNWLRKRVSSLSDRHSALSKDVCRMLCETWPSKLPENTFDFLVPDLECGLLDHGDIFKRLLCSKLCHI